jgi:hypothetical protein
MTIRTAGLALAVLAVTAVAAAGADAKLRWKFRKDKPYNYVLTQDVDMNMKLPNNNVRTKLSQVSEVTWKVEAVKPDGSAEIAQILNRMRMKMEGPTGNFELDSNQKGDAAGAGPAEALNKMMQGIVGVPIRFVMSARGEVISVKVPEKVMEALKTAGPGGQAFAGGFSEKGMKQLLEQSSVLLPEQAVSPGTTWVQKRSVETAGMGSMDIDTTYTDKGETPGKPDLRSIDGAITMQFHQPENSPVSMRIASQDNAAKFLFNTTAGHLSRTEMKQNMQMEISAGGQSFTQDLMQTVSMTLSDESRAK